MGVTIRANKYSPKEVIKTLEEPVVTGVDQMLGIRKQNGMGTWLMPVIADNNFEKVGVQ